MFLSFVIKISCLILSKALLMSRHTTAVTLVWSIARKIASVEDINEVSVECHFLFSFLKYRSQYFQDFRIRRGQVKQKRLSD